jgi:hypothetical protein
MSLATTPTTEVTIVGLAVPDTCTGVTPVAPKMCKTLVMVLKLPVLAPKTHHKQVEARLAIKM